MASASSPLQILLTGATGYIGGTILTQLLNSTSPALKDATISCLVRGPDRVAKLTSAYGSRVRPILYKDIDDLEATVAAAAQHDLVINTTLGYHPSSGVALVRGLSQRKAATGRDVWLIFTSGTSNVGDRPVSKAWVEERADREFDDAADDVYAYEKDREVRDGLYLQRTAELAVVDAGLEFGVKTLVIMSPTIFGIGTGLFNNISIQIPTYIRAVLKQKRGVVVADGAGVWDAVHVQDLAELYLLVVRRILESGGEGVPTGKKGIIFSGNGRHSWREVAQGVADVCYAEGKLTSTNLESLTLAEAAKVFTLGIGEWENEDFVERAFASNSRTVSNVGRKLGWKPTRGEDAWKAGFRDDLKVVLEQVK
ncbi:NAD dependent epimerase/dehydratase family protein [Hypoxylon rubiginosum]|uniref:NAD dependent epimerase/dehydratase family protein n=1 Tax=Hypoxylon rubiginosum TaxID=110542 RepID=A0ACC0CRT1_9PEZI|nr:NAD dependent epimerase/dehydratase family protein [Hypoxylon rubiginosum]